MIKGLKYNTSDIGYWDEYNDFSINKAKSKKKKAVTSCKECEMIQVNQEWICKTCGKKD